MLSGKIFQTFAGQTAYIVSLFDVNDQFSRSNQNILGGGGGVGGHSCGLVEDVLSVSVLELCVSMERLGICSYRFQKLNMRW